MSLRKGPYLFDKGWKAERMRNRTQRDGAGFQTQVPMTPKSGPIPPRSFWMLLFLELPLEGKKTFFLTKSAPPARLWPPINAAVAWSYNRNGIWKGNSSWRNEKHIPLNLTLSNAHKGLWTPILSFPLDFYKQPCFLVGKNIQLASYISHAEVTAVWNAKSREQTFSWLNTQPLCDDNTRAHTHTHTHTQNS